VLEPCGRLHVVVERVAGYLPNLKTDILPDRSNIRFGAEQGPENKQEVEAVRVAEEHVLARCPVVDLHGRAIAAREQFRGLDLEAVLANPCRQLGNTDLAEGKPHVSLAAEDGSRDENRRVVRARECGCQAEERSLRSDGIQQLDVGATSGLTDDNGVLQLTLVGGQGVSQRKNRAFAGAKVSVPKTGLSRAPCSQKCPWHGKSIWIDASSDCLIGFGTATRAATGMKPLRGQPTSFSYDVQLSDEVLRWS
jgi:hypothetical protein